MNAKFELWLMRHAEAEEGVGKPDAERRLLDEGLRDARHQGEALKVLGTRFGAIASSPLRRALQTAEAVAKAIDYHGEIVEDDRLGFEAGVDDMLELMNELREAHPDLHRLLFVGHNPSMGHLKGRLLGKPNETQFKKGALEAYALEFAADGRKLDSAQRIAQIPKP